MNLAIKIYQILNRTERRKAWMVFGLMVLGVLFEAFSIGLVIPALALLTQQDGVGSASSMQRYLPEFAQGLGSLALVKYGMLALVVVYVLKALFLAIVSWQQTLFAFSVQTRISKDLLENYLSRPYTFHLQKNSAQLVYNITTGTNLFTSAILHGLAFLTEISVALAISLLLLSYETQGTLIVVGAFGGLAYVIHKATSKRNVSWGQQYQHHEGMRIQHIQQSLGAVKDILLLGRSGNFVERYSHHNSNSARMARYQNTVQQFPRLAMESFSVAALAALVWILLEQGHAFNSIVPTIGLFATAAFRLMPSANRLVLSLQNLKYQGSAVDSIHGELNVVVKGKDQTSEQVLERGAPMPLTDTLAIMSLHFEYPDSERSALMGIDLVVRRGSTVGFVGSSGSGKSTLIDVILGLLKPQSGSVTVDHCNIHENLEGWQRNIGYVPQSIYLSDESLRENIAFGIPLDQIDMQALDRAIRAAQLEDFISTLPDGLNTLVGERGVRLSGGQRQRIGIARALYNDPSVIVLDEATSALDTETESEVMRSIYALQGQKTILMVAHRLSTVAGCDMVYRLEAGKIMAQGVPSDIL